MLDEKLCSYIWCRSFNVVIENSSKCTVMFIFGVIQVNAEKERCYEVLIPRITESSVQVQSS